MQQVHILLTDLVKVVLALDAHGRDLDPLAVLHIAAGGGDLAQVDLGVEVGGERIAVIAAVAVEDVDGVVDGKEVKMEVKVGDQVIYSKYSGTEVKLDDEEYIIVKQSDILAIIQ
jgi:co-chaperonin GroES (HSP10)